MPVVSLPDGSQRTFANPLTVYELAANIGSGLARAALAGVVNGRLVDTSLPLMPMPNVQLSPPRIRPAWKSFVIRQRTCWHMPSRNSFPTLR